MERGEGEHYSTTDMLGGPAFLASALSSLGLSREGNDPGVAPPVEHEGPSVLLWPGLCYVVSALCFPYFL